MKWVVGPLGIDTDFDVVVRAASLRQNLLNLAAEVAFNFKHQRTRLCLRVCWPGSQQLVSERGHSARRLSTANGTDQDRARKQSALRDNEPVRILRGNGKARIVNLADDDRQF